MTRKNPTAPHRLLAVGWRVPGTGLTRVLENLLTGLSPEWQIDIAGVGCDSPSETAHGMRIHPTDPRGRDTFGLHATRRLMEAIEPDVVLCHHDLWILHRFVRHLRPRRGRTRLVAYVPIDGEITDADLAAPLLDFDLVIVYTEWSRDQVSAAWDRLGTGNRPVLDVLPHGLDHNTFFIDPDYEDAEFSREGRARARAEVFQDLPDSGQKFIVLNPSRPALRKRLDLTLEGFAEFSRHASPDAMLCLHHAVSDADHDREIRAMVHRYGVERRVIINPLGSRVLSDRHLNLLYQACDVGLNTSMGEGWGLTSFEHAAAGGAQVVPDHSACGELWHDCAELIPVARRLIPRFSPLQMAEVEPRSVADTLMRLYREPGLLRRRSRQAHAMATSEIRGWPEISRRLGAMLNQLVRRQ